jgi:hypothetical protein
MLSSGLCRLGMAEKLLSELSGLILSWMDP